MSLGKLPGGSALAGLPQSEGGRGSSLEGEMSTAQLATQAPSLMALLTSQVALDTPLKSSKIWLGEGLGSIPKRTYNRMMKWEFIDMGELRLRTAVEKSMLEPDTQKVVVFPGFEVAQAKQKSITDIITWVHCYSRYTAAMATKYPDCTPGLMSHLLTVLRAYRNVLTTLSLGDNAGSLCSYPPGYPAFRPKGRRPPPSPKPPKYSHCYPPSLANHTTVQTMFSLLTRSVSSRVGRETLISTAFPTL